MSASLLRCMFYRRGSDRVLAERMLVSVPRQGDMVFIHEGGAHRFVVVIVAWDLMNAGPDLVRVLLDEVPHAINPEAG